MKYFKLMAIMLIAINFGAIGQKISPYLFGQNHWMERTDEGTRPGYLYMLWPKVRESGIKTVRIGGGGYERRLPVREKLTAIVDSIHKIGAEPILQVPSTYTAEQATELVMYFNNSSGKRVKFWSIGNEPLLHDRSGIDKVYKYLMRLLPAMKAADPTIKIFVFDECSLFKEDYEALCGGRLDITGKDDKGNWLIDGFTFHRYPNTREDYTRDNVVFTGPLSIRNQMIQLVEMMEKADKKHGRTGDAKLKWGLTEVNVTTSNPDREISGIGNTSFLGGQFMAEIYGLGLELGAFTVAPWCISETDRISTDFGYLGLPSEFYPRSSYYHTQLMALNMKGEFLPSQSSNSYVKSIATRSKNEICVMILNKDNSHDFNFDLVLNSKGESLRPLLINVNAGVEKVITGTIPNQTTMLYVISGTGEIVKQYTYGLAMNLKNKPPEILIPQSIEPVKEIKKQ
jgi:hypothetical protein